MNVMNVMNVARRPAAMLCNLASAIVFAATVGALAGNDAAAQKWPEKTVRFVRDEIAKWTRIIQQAGIKLD